MQDLLKQIEHHYQQLCSATSTFGRVYNGKAILSIMETYPELTQYWMYLPHEFLWQDRFVRVGDYQPTPEVPVFYDDRTNLKLAPKLQGLYFYGNTAFNPETNEVQFWVKIGVSTNLYNRAKAYCTCNPSTYVIGYKTIADTSCYRQEHEYHQLLSRIALFQNQNSEEWWMVDRETYLAMCEKSFDFFA
jgi:hypothetical protein